MEIESGYTRCGVVEFDVEPPTVGEKFQIELKEITVASKKIAVPAIRFESRSPID
jgi:hypothetical protein